jgi:hypothetical protein
VPNGDSYWLVYPEAVAERPKIKAFRDWLLEEAKEAAATRPGASVVRIKANAGRRRGAA